MFLKPKRHIFPCCFFHRRSRQLARLQPRYVPLFLFFSSAVNADKSPFKKCGVLQHRRRVSTLHKRQQTRTPRPRTLIYEPTHTYYIGQRLTFDRMLTLRLVTQWLASACCLTRCPCVALDLKSSHFSLIECWNCVHCTPKLSCVHPRSELHSDIYQNRCFGYPAETGCRNC